MKLRIYLADLTHTGVGIATEAFPLNIGLIASYCLKEFGDDVEIELFKFPEDLKESIDRKKPHILACSNYSWNSNLSYFFANYVKSIDKNIVTVFGGTNYPFDEYNQKLFHKKRPDMDIHTFYEGEKAFFNIVDRFISTSDRKKMFENPIPGCQFLDANGNLIKGDSIPRIKVLDTIPSPYASGLLDKFFEQKLTPLVETARGCPFKCNFCNAGDVYFNKVNLFTDEYVEQELTYIAERANKNDIRHVTFADNNFGMIPRDAKTVDLIYSLMNKYEWPKSVTIWTGKNSKERIIDATRLLGETLSVSMSVQSMDPKVLENVSRSNIKLDHYKAIASELSSQGRPQHAEVIVPLPDETFATHITGLSDLIDTDVSNVVSHTIQMLHGTPYADDKSYVKKYGYKTKHRIVPLDFGKYDKKYIFDTEEVGIATNKFSFQEYLEARKFLLIVDLCFNGNTFDILKKYILSRNLKVSDWVKYIYNKFDDLDDLTKSIFSSFIEESKSELWDSEQELINYYSIKDNYKKLIAGDAGGNVLYRHKAWILSDNSEKFIDSIYKLSSDFFRTKLGDIKKIDDEMNELNKYTQSITLDSFCFDNKVDVSKVQKFTYDILSWFKADRESKLEDFFKEKSVKISFKYDQSQLDIKHDAVERYGNNLSGIVKLIQRVGGIHRFHRRAVIDI